jgi:hypothetical protein
LPLRDCVASPFGTRGYAVTNTGRNSRGDYFAGVAARPKGTTTVTFLFTLSAVFMNLANSFVFGRNLSHFFVGRLNMSLHDLGAHTLVHYGYTDHDNMDMFWFGHSARDTAVYVSVANRRDTGDRGFLCRVWCLSGDRKEYATQELYFRDADEFVERALIALVELGACDAPKFVLK